MMRYRKLVALAVALALCVLVAFPSMALAIIDPDTPPQIIAVYVYDDLLEDGDAGVLIDYFIDYTISGNPPTGETANEAYLGIFVDTDGATQLKAVAPYAYDDLGYGRGLIWIYFSAAEVTSYSIDRANIALYEVWLSGNPTLAWAGDPPKTTAGIDYWQPLDTNTATLFGLRILGFAQTLGTAWAEVLQTETPLGSRLTANGEDYFTNTIPFLRTIAPSIFSSGTADPTLEDLDYSTSFGATMTDGTGTVVGSPITLIEGDNVVNVIVAGTFVLELESGTVGTVTDLVGTVDGSPVALIYGTNTITTPGVGGIGTLTVTVNLVDTQTTITSTVTGTGLDVGTPVFGMPGGSLPGSLGMSTMMLSSLVWLVVTIIICAAVYKISDTSGSYRGTGGKTVLLVFDICLIGGAVLGLMPVLVSVLMFIGFGAITGYVLFFRGASF